VRATNAIVQSEVAPLEVFGIGTVSPPLRRIANPSLDLKPDESRRFLELPPELPQRVRDWAKQRMSRAAPDESNYKRALRLAAALQEGAFYTLRPPLVPADRDATDFFLFESRRGYCTHFAGSLAATCRAVGIPSRVVSGFTNAEWSEEFPGYADLRESGSHAWVEVWEPGWGWVLVDPTPPDNRGDNASSLLQSLDDFRGIIGEFLAKRFAPLNLLPIGVAAALLAAALTSLRKRRVWSAPGTARTSQEDALARQEIERLFARAARRVTRRFRPRAPWETPGEWLAAAHEPLNLRDEAPLRELFELLVLARFSPYALDATHAQRARDAWARLSWAKKPRVKQAPEIESAASST
jgi:transglutaminase-like putative cysteine protease